MRVSYVKSNWLFSLYIRENKQRRSQKSCKKNNFKFKVIFEEGGTRENLVYFTVIYFCKEYNYGIIIPL